MTRLAATYLRAAGALALAIAEKEERGQHWDGELLAGIAQVREQLENAAREAARRND